jgi:CMP-N-acetylneuraminic acid synthetase
MKVVCMIPARAGSKRIKNKNLRDLGGIPMIAHAIRAAKHSGSFDEIYVNSESTLIGQSALDEGVRFYKRPEHLASDEATNDEFMEDFLRFADCDYVVQLLPTSPFITPKEVQDFTNLVATGDYDTVVSVKDVQIECVYDNKPINFDQKEPTPPSQALKPIQAYACTLMGWKRESFLKNMDHLGCAYHGGDGDTAFFPIKGFSEIDIDNEEDFELAESVWRHMNE